MVRQDVGAGAAEWYRKGSSFSRSQRPSWYGTSEGPRAAEAEGENFIHLSLFSLGTALR